MPGASSFSWNHVSNDEEAPIFFPSSEIRDDSVGEEEREWLLRRQEQPGWRVDNGAVIYQEEREKKKRSYLVETGRRAGRSCVKYEGIPWGVILTHILKRDFFNAAVNAKLWLILLALCFFYTGTVTIWAHVYYATWRLHPQCFSGFSGAVSAFMFSVETQQTIGYGVRAPTDCWVAAVLVAVHSLLAVLFDSIILGIAFARISHPKNRGRTVLISNCSVISRRDGVLKFRVADIQRSTVVTPRISAFLYTWGDGAFTSEGERIPVRMQELRIDSWDRSLLLPSVVEHTIDESSPLYGLSHKKLESLDAEIVVVFEGSTELGDMFMVRQSYLSPQIHWGHSFCTIVSHAPPGGIRHTVDLSRFHDVEPQEGLEALPPHKLSAKVISSGARPLPLPLPQENTLVLSEEGVVGYRDGRPFLMFRVGDTYPCSQVEDVVVKARLYRWTPRMTAEGEELPFSVKELPLYPATPSLRYPVTVVHDILGESSPISSWATHEGKRLDADCEIVVTVKGILSGSHRLVTRTHVYPVVGSIKWGAVFQPMVSRSAIPGAANVDWSRFHLHAPSSTLEATASVRSSGANRPSSFIDLNAAPEAATALSLSDAMSQFKALRGAGPSEGDPKFQFKPDQSIPGATALPGKPPIVSNIYSNQPLPGMRVPNPSLTSTSRPASVSIASGSSTQHQVSDGTHFGNTGRESWHDRRSLFAALDSLNKLAQEQQSQQDSSHGPHDTGK